MANSRKLSRTFLVAIAVFAIASALAAAFWPRAILVDVGRVGTGDLMVTIDEEGRTRVRETYIVSTPVVGRLMRVQVHSGDEVVVGQTVAQMRPTSPAALDVRTREQARAAVEAAEAALRVAQSDLNAALAAEELATADLSRTQSLFDSGFASRAALERAQSAARAARASHDTAQAGISMREAQLANARAQLIGIDDAGLASAITADISDEFPLVSPIDGRILRVMQESATTLPAGTPIMEIGNIETDLEIIVELISSDAVKVSLGDRVLLEDWGGTGELKGEVRRIYPYGETKFSALGVEEQRVVVEVALLSPASERSNLGHNYRLKARVVIWSAEDILTAPASSIFAWNDGLAVFVVQDSRAVIRAVETGESDGVRTQVLSGLDEGETVILYPSAEISDGGKVDFRDQS